MPYNYVADRLCKKRNIVADFLQAKCDYRPKTAVSRFELLSRHVGATYDDHLRLTGKRIVDFLLM